MSDVVVNVALDEEGQRDPEACARGLEALGLRHVSVRRVVGVVTGEVPEASLDRLRGAPGVRAVEVDRPVWALSPDRVQPPAPGHDGHDQS